MAFWSDATKLDKIFKWMFLKSRGDNNSQYFEESIPTALDVHASEVYSEPIVAIPPATTTPIIKKWYPAGETGDGWITLTKDSKYNGNRVWVALGTWNSNWSSGSGDVSQILKNFISPKYGNSYLVRLYDGNDNPIPELDNSSWLFDYKSGVLTFEVDRAETGTTEADSIKIKVYQYVGRFADSAGTSTLGNRIIEKFYAAPAQQDFILQQSPQDHTLLDVYLNGLLLEENVEYNLVGSTLHLNSTELYDTDKIMVKYW